MLDSSRCAPATARPAGTQRPTHTIATIETAVARTIAPISASTIDDGWRDDLTPDAPAPAHRTARADSGTPHPTDLPPAATRTADDAPRRPVSIAEYRRSLTACPVCGTRLSATDRCHGCGEQWWRCQDLARAVDLPRGYLRGLIAIGWLPAVPSASGAWVRQRDAERVIADFATVPLGCARADQAREQSTLRLVPLPATELPDG